MSALCWFGADAETSPRRFASACIFVVKEGAWERESLNLLGELIIEVSPAVVGCAFHLEQPQAALEPGIAC